MHSKYFFFIPLIVMCNYSFSQTKIAQKEDTIKQKELQEVVVTATRTAENKMQAPVSIEGLSQKDISKSGQLSFFDALENVKGVVMITPSLGFKVINARGFTNTTNVRFVQMVDGADNQAPTIGAPIANSMGPTDLDILKVEVIPGSASALYGMNAINGTANFITKNPFQYQGISIAHKTGLNHISDKETNAQLFTETNIRYAKALTNKFAFKLNASYTQGKDWYADSKVDLNPNANKSTNLWGSQNPGSDLVNNYGDESSDRSTLTMADKKQYIVSRTGYSEKQVSDYGLKNWKGDVALHYRPTNALEMSYSFRYANLNTLYQRTNRFRFDNYQMQQHSFNLKSRSIQFKAYATIENSGNSYNIRSMAENIDNYFKPASKWFSDFTGQFNKDYALGKTTVDAMADARAYADNGRPQPGSPLFNHLVDTLRKVNNWDVGAALRVKANLYHAEMQLDITEGWLPNLRLKHGLNLMYGFDYNLYSIVPDGNYFINPAGAGNLTYWKTGGFIQATKYFFSNKLKINAVARLDKNQYFDALFNPRLALVYSLNEHNSLRVAVQSGSRFPSISEAFSNINSGGVKRVGGLQVMSHGIFENSYTDVSVSAFQSAVTNDVNKNGFTTAAAITREKGLLQKNTYMYVKPEKVNSLEAGYRGKLLKEKLLVDVDFFYNTYKNLIAQINADVPNTTFADSIPFYLNKKSLQSKYRLWTNSKSVSYNYGGTLGITYLLPKDYTVGGNLTINKLDRQTENDGLEDGFNTPEWIYNVSLGNENLYKNLGFNINYRQQASYTWLSSLANGTVPSYATFDAQLSYKFIAEKLTMKLGATNILNKYYYSYTGGPSVGGFYHLTLVWGM